MQAFRNIPLYLKMPCRGSEKKLIAERTAESEKAFADQRDLPKRKPDDCEIKIEALDSKYRAVRVAGALRLPDATCRSAASGEASASGTVELTEATSEGIISEAPTERIPEITEERLYALAKKADELAEQLKAL